MSDTDATRALLIRAARELNAGRYFEAHEVIEEALDEVPEPLFDLFVGLIQIAVGYHKRAQRITGAAGMLQRGIEKLAGFADDEAGLDLAALREQVRRDLAALRTGTPSTAIPRLRFLR